MEARIIKFNGSSAFLEVFKNNRSSNDRYNTLKIETPEGKQITTEQCTGKFKESLTEEKFAFLKGICARENWPKWS